MTFETEPFRIAEGAAVRLADRATCITPVYSSKADYRDRLHKHVKALSKLQQAHAAAERCALLLIFQAVDAGGKDSAIRHVLSGVNPQGCQVFSFKPPSAAELRHDFLWRTTLCLPERGRIGVFNRSYYEEVLVVRVHPHLLEPEGIVEGDEGPDLWAHRFISIRDLEAHLSRNGTKIVKFFLHISKGEQRRRFLRRIDRPEKTWKFDPVDMVERERWDDYAGAYEACLEATSTEAAPWYVIPADDKKTARLIVAKVVRDTLADLHPHYPKPAGPLARTLAEARERLERE